MSKQIQVKSVGGYPIVAANTGTSKVYSVSNKTVANILHKVGYAKKDLISHIMPKPWYSPADIRALTDVGYAEEDISIILHECKSVAKKVSEFFSGSMKEGSAEQRLADTSDYWNKFAGKFGKEFMNIRAVKHDGQILFLVDDIAKIYGGSYAVNPRRFVQELSCKGTKKCTLHKLSYNQILMASPSSSSDARGFRQGKHFISRNDMMLVLQQSNSPAALQYRNHLISILEKDIDRHEKERVEQRAKGSEERDINVELGKRFTESCAKKGLIIRTMQGELNLGFFGMPKKQYMQQNSIAEPMHDNLSIRQVNGKNMAYSIAVADLDDRSDEDIVPKEGKIICYSAGLAARMMMESKDLRSRFRIMVQDEAITRNIKLRHKVNS